MSLAGISANAELLQPKETEDTQPPKPLLITEGFIFNGFDGTIKRSEDKKTLSTRVGHRVMTAPKAMAPFDTGEATIRRNRPYGQRVCDLSGRSLHRGLPTAS